MGGYEIKILNTINFKQGELVYYELLGFIPVPNGVQINAAVDVSFTAMSVKAEIFTEGPEDQNLWEQFSAGTPKSTMPLPVMGW